MRVVGKISSATLSEINVVPFVDIMLVLLITFMISAPLMQQGAQVDLPKANAGSLNETSDELVLVVKRNQRILLNGKRVQQGTLRKRLRAIAVARPRVQVFIQSDRKVPYGFVARVLAEVKQAKIQRVGLVTKPGTKNARL